jgi:hypothetical protein
MSSECYTLWKIPTVRVTKLNSCGLPVTGCSTVVSDGIISVNLTKEYEARQEFFKKNGDGTFCVTKTNPPILKWVNIVATFCGVDPELVNIMSGEAVVRDDSSGQVATGFSTEEGAVENSFFALEAWTRLADVTNGAPCSGSAEYGYVLLPFVIEGTIGDMNLQNDSVDFVLNARTSNGSNWGTGPYNIDYSDNPAGSTTPIPLLTPIRSGEHARQFTVRMPPPDAACGCTTLSDLTP